MRWRQSHAWVARRACSDRGVVGRARRGQPGLVRQAAQHGYVVHGEVIGRCFVLPSHDSARALSRRGQSASARPSRCTVPVCGIRPRQCAQQGVDLPAPFGPTMLVQHPASTGR